MRKILIFIWLNSIFYYLVPGVPKKPEEKVPVAVPKKVVPPPAKGKLIIMRYWLVQ